MQTNRVMWVLWPAFLVACVLEMLVFAMVDPADLNWLGQPIELSRQGVYTVAFFVFWALAGISSAVTSLLSHAPLTVNREPLADGSRPHRHGVPR